MLNAGKYNHRIAIYKIVKTEDALGFASDARELVMMAFANVKTTKGFTLIANNADFEKAYTNFTIRYSETVEDAYYAAQDSNREVQIDYNGKTFKVEYLKNIDEENVEIEMQAKEILK